ncbi:hypothetical protein ACQ4M4_06020 [Leptolyngbya sp. AN02str]|uniref:hypothetical protein n=1 Tax=Leptolyngbya sp. AN02str TaxID=3423363 RepID=UPI003D31CF1B
MPARIGTYRDRWASVYPAAMESISPSQFEAKAAAFSKALNTTVVGFWIDASREFRYVCTVSGTLIDTYLCRNAGGVLQAIGGNIDRILTIIPPNTEQGLKSITQNPSFGREQLQALIERVLVHFELPYPANDWVMAIANDLGTDGAELVREAVQMQIESALEQARSHVNMAQSPGAVAHGFAQTIGLFGETAIVNFEYLAQPHHMSDIESEFVQ